MKDYTFRKLVFCGISPIHNVDHDGIGVYTKTPIKKDDILFIIPNSCILSPETSRLPPIFNDVLGKVEKNEAYNAVESWIPLVFALLYEIHTDKSKYQPYIDVLPQFDELQQPMFWNEEEREWLRNTEVYNSMKEEDQQMKDVFSAIEPIFKQILPIESPFDEMRRTFAIIRSYSFTEQVESSAKGNKKRKKIVKDYICMVPFADTLNHVTGKNNARLFHGREKEMMAISDIPADSQLYNTYGDLDNAELLLKYGFCDCENYGCVYIGGVGVVDEDGDLECDEDDFDECIDEIRSRLDRYIVPKTDTYRGKMANILVECEKTVLQKCLSEIHE